MKDAEIAWAAGLFEGEGSILIMNSNDGHHRLAIMRLSITMTDRDVLEKFCRIVDCGKVGPARRYGRPHHKPTYVWQISNRRDLERILVAFLPWLGERRSARAHEALAEIATLQHVCKNCGKQFRARRADMLCCSVKCRNRWNYLNRRPLERPSKVGRPRTI